MEILELLTFAKQNSASDLHLSTGNPPVLRIHGDVMPLNTPPLNAEQVKHLLYRLMTEQQRSIYERELELDFAVSFGADMRFRINAFNTINGPAASFRDIPTKIKTVDELKAPQILKSLSNLKKGLVLVTGPTGSGKSTTMAAMVDYMNTTHSHHIITIEDPVEFVHQSKRSLINQRQVGENTKSFTVALKSALREDPDIILVGEMRDLETIRLALSAAETGHLVLGTLHTNSAPKTIDRIIDVFPANEKEMIRAMLSSSIEGVITQNLLKKADGQGRIAVHEIMLGTPAVRNLIREGKIPQLVSLIQTGSKHGMQLMKDVVAEHLKEGNITEEVARVYLHAAGDEEHANGGQSRPGGTQQGHR